MSEKTIQFKGIDRATPQSMSAAGTCQEIINARFRKGYWRPIGEKIQEKPLDVSDYGEIWLHDIENGLVSGEPNWIGYKKDIGILFLINQNTGASSDIVRDETPGVDINVVFLKRTMIVSSESGVEVFLFTEDKATSNKAYIKTSSLPIPDISLVPGILDAQKTTRAFSAEAVLGEYYSTLNKGSEDSGLMYGSIMYIAAYRLFDGSYILPSVPRYVEITNGGSIFRHNPDGGHSDDRLFSFIIPMKKLSAIIDNTAYPSESFESMKDLIDSICIFSTKVTPLLRVDETTVTDKMLNAIPSTNDQYITPFRSKFPVNDEFTKLAKSAGWYKIHEISFEEIVGKTGLTTKEVDTKGFYQDYATRETLTTDQFTHHQLSAREAYVYNDRLHLANIKTSVGKPYIQWDNKATTESRSAIISVWLKTSLGRVIRKSAINIPIFKAIIYKSVLTYSEAEYAGKILELMASSTVVPDSITGSKYKTGATTYELQWKEYDQNNNELSFEIPSIVGYNDSRAYRMQITVSGCLLFDEKLTKNEYLNFATWNNNKFTPDILNLEANYRVSNIDPYRAYIDREAWEDTVTDETFIKNFKVYYESYTQASDIINTNTNYKKLRKVESTVNIPTIAPEEIGLPFDTNRVQVSEIQNPLIFPTKNSYQIGTGSIIKLMAGSEPLSTGQFGQFPLQVFTTKGIWALEIGLGDVLYTNVLPVNGEVAENPKNVVPVGSGVVYSTVKGLFIVNGRQVTEIAEIVEGKPETGVSGSDEITTLCTDAKFTPELSGSISDINFLTYLQNSSVGFDQLNKELVVSNPDKAYSYIFSFESKAWFKISRSFKLLINAYPNLLAATNTDVISLSNESEIQDVNVLIISNCQNFDMPNIHKKVERSIFRSNLTTQAGKQAGFYVFASDDMLKYQLITGCQRSGTAIDMTTQRSHVSARNYVFVVNGCLSPDSEIKQIETVFINKWNNNLR